MVSCARATKAERLESGEQANWSVHLTDSGHGASLCVVQSVRRVMPCASNVDLAPCRSGRPAGPMMSSFSGFLAIVTRHGHDTDGCRGTGSAFPQTQAQVQVRSGSGQVQVRSKVRQNKPGMAWQAMACTGPGRRDQKDKVGREFRRDQLTKSPFWCGTVQLPTVGPFDRVRSFLSSDRARLIPILP